MKNLFRLRRRLKEFEGKVRRLKQADGELSSLAARASSIRFANEIGAISPMIKNPAKVNEVEKRIRALAKDIDDHESVRPGSAETTRDASVTSGWAKSMQTGHPVFISHSVTDAEAACAVCSSLEARGIPCWMATRNIVPGQNWADAVVRAINDAQIMVLVLSSAANASSQVLGEVERASAKDIPIIAVRLENMPLSRPLELFLGKRHWLDATKPPFERCLDKLADAIQRLVSPAESEDGQRTVA